jgi:hypothetical protein
MKTQRVYNAYLTVYYSTFSSKRFVNLRFTEVCSTVPIKGFIIPRSRVDYSTLSTKRLIILLLGIDRSTIAIKGFVILRFG